MTAPQSGAARSRAQARLAGGLYLAIVALGLWSEVGVRAGLIVPGDAAATAANILAAPGLFRLGFAADALMAFADAGLAVLLFVLLRPAGRTLALMAMVFRLVQTAIIAMNLLNQHTALALLEGAGRLGGLGTDEVRALALLALETHAAGYDLGLLFFGINSVLTGYLISRSGYLPRLLGGLMAAAGLVYLVGGALVFLAPAMAGPFAPAYLVPVLAETGLALWLLVRGVDAARWARAAGRLA